MSQQLTDFLTRLATDDDLVTAFENDKEATMKSNGITQEHIDLVVNKEYSKVQAILGADYDIAKNGVIRAFKK